MPSGAFFRIRTLQHSIKNNTMKLLQYLKETKNELKEVVFPSMSQTATFTTLVIVISVVVALFLGGIDLGLKELLTKIVSR